MNNRRSAWDDYAELMSLVPEGNRQIVAAIGRGVRKLTRKLARRLRHARQRTPDRPMLP
jgi:hypothetical protein